MLFAAVRWPLMAPLRHAAPHAGCRLSGVKRKLRGHRQNDVIDPSATLAVHCGDGFDTDFCPIKVLARADRMPFPKQEARHAKARVRVVAASAWPGDAS